VEMASIVAGNTEQLRKRSPVNANICTISPLAHDSNGIESALIYAEAGIPISFMAMTTMGATAPYTPFGALVTGDAEVVSGMVLIQLAFPRTPVFYSVLVTQMNPMTGEYIAKVPLPTNMMAVELGHAWNVPCIGGARMGSDAHDIGWQSGMESALGAAVLPWGSGEIGGHIGLLAGAMILYPEQIILDHEICQTVYGLFYGADFQPDTMALEVIKDIGPRNDFLTHDHTVKHIRDYRISPLLHPKPADGKRLSPREAALEEYKLIESTHHPESLPKEILSELDQVLTSAEKEMANEV